jgi:hypothetical protein
MRGRRAPDCIIELGLAISRLSMRPGETRTAREISYFCNCSAWAISLIERRAIRKMRVRLAPFLKECTPEAEKFFNSMIAK